MYTISSLKQGNIDIPPFLKETEDQFNPFQGWQDSNQSKKGDIFRSSYN